MMGSTSDENSEESSCSQIERDCSEKTANSSHLIGDSKPTNQEHHVLGVEGIHHLNITQNELTSNPTTSSVPENSNAVSSLVSEEIDSPSSSEASSGSLSGSPTQQSVYTNWQVQKWQTRQVARAFVDNTINCVLEGMGYFPLPDNSHDFLDDAFTSTSRNRNNGNLMDEAVLMAIQSHGLHRSHESKGIGDDISEFSGTSKTVPVENLTSFTSMVERIKEENDNLSPEKEFECITRSREGCSNQEENCDSSARLTPFAVCTCPIRHTSDIKESTLEPFHLRTSLTNVPNEERLIICQTSQRNNLCHATCDCCKEENGLRKCKLCSKKRESEENVSQSCKKHCNDISKLKLQPLPSVQLNATSSLNSDSDLMVGSSTLNEAKTSSFEHLDFMDAAVAAAIRKKGLSALACTEYS